MCEFSTCNLSYGELSCSLLFGSNRLMPGVCLNKSTMRSSGVQSPLSFTFQRFPSSWQRRRPALPLLIPSLLTLSILLFSPLLSDTLTLHSPCSHFIHSFPPLISYWTSSLFTPPFSSRSPASSSPRPDYLYRTDKNKPLWEAGDLVKTPIRNSENR